ncbi:MAG: hypothetical protein HYY84_19180 [Deltaproteobacteria bacterium]|nr:hypothetical protein [Deltaproteobacteria bacterium]
MATLYQSHRRSGFSKEKNWVRTVVLYSIGAAVVYAGVLFVPVLWRNHKVNNALHESGNNAYRQKDDAALREALKRRVRDETDITLSDEQIEIAWGPEKKSLTLATRYEQVVRFWPLSARLVLRMNPSVSKDLTRINWDKKGCG